MNMVLAPQLITARCSGVLSLTISANVNNLNLFVLSGSPTEAVNIELTIDAAVVVGSTTTTSAALTTGALPLGSTVMIINMGRIQGAGGNGGAGSGVNNHGTPGSPGGSGGTALELFAQTSIQNANGEIYGGGGGGGGASSIFDGGPMAFYHGGGGGGGAGAPQDRGAPVLMRTYRAPQETVERPKRAERQARRGAGRGVVRAPSGATAMALLVERPERPS